jgi:leucyl-tRNA synthetase
MGWDSFGLPAENAAVERGEDPRNWTVKNIALMKTQMKTLGLDFDWDHEVSTCDPAYYKWTQWIFTKLFDAGLAFQKESYVNYDPVDKTVLANEQVDAQGKSWRSGAVVEKRLMKQWYLRITDYAEPLLNDLQPLDNWPERVKKMQAEWIGKTDGASIDFNLIPFHSAETSQSLDSSVSKIQVFTTRADTLLGCTFLVVAPESPLVMQIADPSLRESIQQFQKETLAIDFAARLDQKRKKRGLFIGRHVQHPISNESIPVYIADYVVADYATGAVMGVPGHDTRDFAFANDHSLTIKQVVKVEPSSTPAGHYATPSSDVLPITKHGEGTRLINSGKYDGMTTKEAANAMINEKLSFLKPDVSYNLRDWLVSRQRYWGAPIPIIHCEAGCGAVAVPEDQLPVELPNIDFTKHGKPGSTSSTSEMDFEKGKGSPLAAVESFVKCKCPKCGKDARRETDTMDTFVDSSWYFMRYPDAQNSEEAFSKAKADKWLPVDLYVGGIEHAILHLLYARFINKFMFDEGYVPNAEPFVTLRTQGMVHGKTFRLPGSERPVKPEEVLERPDGTATLKTNPEQTLDVTWEKMSKSKYNGVDPVAVVEEFGADTIRLFLLFKAPVDQVLDWDTNQIVGQLRWLRRIWTLIQHWKLYRSHHQDAATSASDQASVAVDNLEHLKNHLRHVVHETTRSVTTSMFETHAFNVAIAKLMTLSNELSEVARMGSDQLGRNFRKNELMEYPEFEQGLKNLIIMLSPMAPHFSSEAWLLLHSKVTSDDIIVPDLRDNPVLQQTWPSFNEEYLEEVSTSATIPVAVHVGGKHRITLDVTDSIEVDALKELITKTPQLQKYLEGKTITKFVHVPNKKMVNLVVQ